MRELNSPAANSIWPGKLILSKPWYPGAKLASVWAKTWLSFFFIVLAFNSLKAQVTSSASLSLKQSDSTFNQLKTALKTMADDQQKQSAENYQQHKRQLDQGAKFAALFNEIQNVKGFLKKGFEYKKVIDLITQVTEWKGIAVEGVITNRDSLQSTRNLTATSILLNELVSRIEKWEMTIKKYHHALGGYQFRLDSLAQDSALYQLPDNTAAASDYFQKLRSLKSNLTPVNAAISGALDSIQYIELQVGLLRTNIALDIAETESLRKKHDEKSNFNEVAIMQRMTSGEKSFSEIMDYSQEKASLLVTFYILNHLYTILLMLLALIGISAYLRILIKRSKQAKIYDQLQTNTYALAYPTASATLISFTLFQFFLPLPPFIFTSFLWVVCSFSLTMILRRFISRTWFYVWLFYLLLLMVSLFLNFILIQSEAERWVILLMSIAGMVAGAILIRRIRKKVPNQRSIYTLLVITTVFETIATLFNLYGNYNYSKGFMTNGYLTIVVAFMVYWTIILSKDILKTSRYFHRMAEDNKQQLLLKRVDISLPVYWYLLLFVAWFILISRNTHTFQTWFEPLSELFYKNWSIGKFDFTLQSVSIFFIVIFLSGIIAKIVSFLTADVDIIVGSSTAKGPGSWLLLVRIAIITAGIIIAFVSAGIPMDRMAVVMGALGVGIGFGMQPLVNSLIGGLIIAFEKPINVGDIVEISGQVGKMKSIGIRSSVVTTWDGADVIIPNGDLMTQHLVNWTMGNTKRRFEIAVGVAYGTDLERTIQLLMQLMSDDHRILKYPEPIVLVSQFNNSSVDLVLKFWVAHFITGFEVKSDLMVAVDALFKEHHIVIPFPQRDVHLYPISNASEPPAGKDNSAD